MFKILIFLLIFVTISCKKAEDSDSGAATGVTFTDPVGSLDTSFGTSGIYNDNTVAYTGSYIAKQSSGKILVASKNGNFWVLTRFSVNGTLDATFGTAGVLSTDMSASIALSELLIDSNDRILLVGQTKAMQFNSDGSVNTSFATAGIYTIAGLSARSAVMDSSGSYWLAGHSGTTLVVQKVSSVGVLVASYSPIAGTTQIYGIAIDADDNLYPVGIISDGGWKGLLAKIKPDGTADTTFGVNTLGWVSYTMAGGYADTKDAVVLADGSIVVSGVLDVTRAMFLAKIDSTGVLDAGFGTLGTGFINEAFSGTTSNAWYQGWDIQLLENGKILVAGNDNNEGVLAKYGADGIIDAAFGTAGYFNVDVNAQADIVEAFVINDDGSVVMTGYSADKLYVAKIN